MVIHIHVSIRPSKGFERWLQQRGTKLSAARGTEIINLDLWKAINKALNKCSALIVARVKGHVGISGKSAPMDSH